MIKYLTLLFLILTYPILSNTSEIIVSKSGKYQSVIEAIKIANRGDTIIVEKGTYFESGIVIDKPLTIIGKPDAIIDGMQKGYIFEVLADSVSIIGLTLNNVELSYIKDFAAIHAYRINHFLFENLTFNNPFFAFHLKRSKHGIIRNNVINGSAVYEHSSGNGIHIWKSSHIEVLNNEVYQMRDGIYFEFVDSSRIVGNIAKRNVRYGLHFMFSNDDVYIDNLFEDNGAGVAVMYSKRISMSNNIFRLNWGSSSYGLLLKDITDSEIYNNIFSQNTMGIYADGAHRITYKNNDFINNGWAVKFLGGCYDNKFYHNNFLNNSFDVSYSGRLNGNLFDNNYWSKYVGYDLNRDNIGDIPYRPIKLFSYIVNRSPESIILLRSLFIDIINFSEKVSPIFTPDNLKDFYPLMKPVK